MQIKSLHIQNFKSVRELDITNIENSLILVGKNNTGKTVVLDAIRLVMGGYVPVKSDFNEKKQNIEIGMTLEVTESDLKRFHANGIVSNYKRYDSWLRDFKEKLPGYVDGILEFSCLVNYNGLIRYDDGFLKNNLNIPKVLPKVHFIDTTRNPDTFQDDLLLLQRSDELASLKGNSCMFNGAKGCNHCFNCIGLINNKKPEELNLQETVRLLEHKVYELNLGEFSKKVNENYRKNGGAQTIHYTLSSDTDKLFNITAEAVHPESKRVSTIEDMGNGMKSIYMLSLLETYVEDDTSMPSIIMVEYPELFLHPSLQKTASKILYRLSKKNQVIFTTHSPNMVSNFTKGQVWQMVLDEDGYSTGQHNVDIDDILNDLGYSANDFLNVDFVFIVEGKQDKNRFPLLLNKYYSELYNEDGEMSRISIIITNSCTNIKTYANLKYMNQLYLRDQFLMIRDGDGKNPEELAGQLCRYYSEQNKQDIDRLPRVGRENVLILKYYSFENYFLNPKVMAQLGIVKSEEHFWKILFSKWKQYLHKISSGKRFVEAIGKPVNSIADLKEHFEEFKIHVRGHNLYDIFYGRFRDREKELLKEYLNIAPREDFKDILDVVDSFVYFHNRKK